MNTTYEKDITENLGHDRNLILLGVRADADINHMVKTIEQLKKEIAYLDAKIESATRCHPNAVQTLLDEAKHRTHFNA